MSPLGFGRVECAGADCCTGGLTGGSELIVAAVVDEDEEEDVSTPPAASPPSTAATTARLVTIMAAAHDRRSPVGRPLEVPTGSYERVSIPAPRDSSRGDYTYSGQGIL